MPSTNSQRRIDLKIVDGAAKFGFDRDSDGNFIITPNENDGFLDITFYQNENAVFQNTLSVVSGSIIFNSLTRLVGIKEDSTISLKLGDYTLNATAEGGDIVGAFVFTSNGLSISPNADSGTLKLTLGGEGGSMIADIKFLSGSFTLGNNGAINVAQNTELQLKFSEDYIVNFKATDAAGGKISITTDGITFAPNSEDGGLELPLLATAKPAQLPST